MTVWRVVTGAGGRDGVRAFGTWPIVRRGEIHALCGVRRRQAIEVELGLQRRVQDIKAGLRRRNAA